MDWVADIVLEMARLHREAEERARRRMAAQQLGEAFVGLERERKEQQQCRAS